MNTANTNKKGFTLLELLIVIAIIAVLSVLLIIVLDPSETLKRARDSQRVSDLNTIKTALGIYLESTSTPKLDINGQICLGETAPVLSYSRPGIMGTCSAPPTLGPDAVVALSSNYCTSSPLSTYTAVDGSGWIPVNFLALSGGAPISNLPVDPTNSIANTAAPTSTDLVYRYLCQQQTTSSSKPAHAYQIATVLESALYGKGGTSDLAAKDGAPNPNYYMSGSDSQLMPASGGNF